MCWCRRAARAPTSSTPCRSIRAIPRPPDRWRVVVAGEPLPMKLPAALPKPPLEAIRDSEITGRRTVVLSAIGDPPENYPGGLWPEFIFMIDGKPFDPTGID